MAKSRRVQNKTVSGAAKKQVTTAIQLADGKPLWRFSTTDKAGPFAWPKGKQEELEIVAKLHEFDSMQWSEIVGPQHHYLSEDSLSKQARDRLVEIQLDDYSGNLFSFHLQGKSRIIVVKISNIAKLLWYDPEHQVCPSRKKHT